MKRPTDITARIWQAVRRLEGRGERPTNHAVRDELEKLYGAGGSFREIAPVVEAWRLETITKAERRIEAVVAAVSKLEHDVEREEVCKRFRERTGQEIRLTIHKKLRKSG